MYFGLFDLFQSFQIWYIYQCLSLSIWFYQAPHFPIPMKIWNSIGPIVFCGFPIFNDLYNKTVKNYRNILSLRSMILHGVFQVSNNEMSRDTLELDWSSWHQRFIKKTLRILFKILHQITSRSFTLSDTLIS